MIKCDACREEVTEHGSYRYLLGRKLQSDAAKKKVVFVLLNPSTADAKTDDPTIRRCIGFARREDFSELEVINLFPLRATHKNALVQSEFRDTGRNLEQVAETVASVKNDKSSIIIAGWGSEFAECIRQKATIFYRDYLPHDRLYCLGVNKDGSPKHPLYLAADTPLIPYRRQVRG